jgi:hypothetical protein
LEIVEGRVSGCKYLLSFDFKGDDSNVDSSIGSLRRVDVASVSDVSEVYAGSMGIDSETEEYDIFES